MILTLSDIKINVDFENLIPKLTTEQFTRLEENMVGEGRARNPLVIWKGHDILTDGHNRLRVLKAHPELSWTFVEQDYADEDEVKEWIIKNALGTRNLTEIQFTLLTSQLFDMRKKKRGAPTGNNNAKKQKSEKQTFVSADTAGQLAKELGIDRSSVYSASRVAHGLEAAEAVIPGITAQVENGELKAQKGEMASWGKKTPEQIIESVDAVKARGSKKNKTNLSETKELLKKIDNISAEMASVSTTQYGLTDLLKEIDALGDSFILSLSSIIKRRSATMNSYDNSADKVCERIDTVINKLNDMKKGFENG